MINIDFKVTAWERVSIDDKEKAKEVLTMMESGTIKTANDLIGFLGKDGDDSYEYEGILLETDTQMTPEENNGRATIEVRDEEVYIWDNVDKYKVKI